MIVCPHYRRKEVNIFSKLERFSDTEFESRVEEISHKNLSRMQQEAEGLSTTQGDFWLDCTAGAFRDFNAAAHLLKYSPLTKIIMIVRDPWQVSVCAAMTCHM
jgi:hypothetical protein